MLLTPVRDREHNIHVTTTPKFRTFPDDFPTLVEGVGFDHSRPNVQIAMNLFRGIRRMVGLPWTSEQFHQQTDPAHLARVEAHRAIMAEREAVAAANGGTVCHRCGGAGGHSSWPGWTCFDCEGRGWVS